MAYEFIGSPNYTQGRESKIDRIVIHWMVGTLAATDAVFQNTQSNTSAHYGIENYTTHQYVNDSDTAYHAGNWNMNTRSIGIEHSAAPGRDATPETLESSAQLIAAKCKEFGIPCDRNHIIKHSEVIATQCPGTIPIDSLVARANQILNGGGEVASITTKNDAASMFAELLGRGGSDDELKTWTGIPFPDAYYGIATSPEGVAFTEQVRKWQAGGSDEFKPYDGPPIYIKKEKK